MDLAELGSIHALLLLTQLGLWSDDAGVASLFTQQEISSLSPRRHSLDENVQIPLADLRGYLLEILPGRYICLNGVERALQARTMHFDRLLKHLSSAPSDV